MLKHLTKTQNVLAQIGLVIFHALAQMPDSGGVLSGSPVAHILIGIAQAIIALRAHSVNPDGTPAHLPYRPPEHR